jgi:nitrate reductase gamma subunit
MNYVDFLLWVRGPAFQIALTIFLFGITLRFFEIFLLGRSPDYSEPRGNAMQGGLRTIITRSKIDHTKFERSTLTILLGYTFHFGFLLILFFYEPHIMFFRELFGFSWPNISTPIISGLAILTILVLLGILFHRIESVTLRFLSTPEDYFVWVITFLPVLTGYMAFHHMFLPYPVMLALHILSVEILMIVFPFTKLMHAFTIFFARWYNGANAGRKGVEA